MSDAPVYLVTGPEELLVRREVERIIDDLRARAGELEITDLRAEELKDRGVPDLRTGSLFGTRRAVRIRDAQDLASDHVHALLAQLEGAPPDATLILQGSGTGRIRRLAKRVEELGGRIDVAPPAQWKEDEWLRLVAAEFDRHGRTAAEPARRAVLEHAGVDTGVIAEKVAQVVAATAATSITTEHVEAVVVGHGDRGAFAVADAMCDRNPSEAIVLLRGVLEAGHEPVMVLGALTYRLRTVVAAKAGFTKKEEIGTTISGGQRARLKHVQRNFGPGELTHAYRVLADADLALKGSDLPPEQVLEHAVIEIATPRPAAG